MYLQKIEIYGFKSFAEKTTIDFKKGITAIVGPNGSGKSNIVDAIRWVLGEQSMKSLRGQKSEDIIFNGTEFRRKLGYAEVSIYFSNDDGFFNIDFKEIKITRKIYRNGDSEYLINDSKVRLKEIQELLMGTGIGRDGYSIIGQGKIDEILSSSGEDRKRIFEEASGIMKYKYRKKDAEKKLEQTDLNLIRIRDILNEINANIEVLEEKSNKAKSYLSLSRELEDIETKIFLKSLNEIKNKKENLNNINKTYLETQKKLKEEKEKLEENKIKLVNSKEELKKELEALNIYSLDKEKENEDIKRSIVFKNEVIKKTEEEIQVLNLDIEKLQLQIENKTIEYKEKYDRYLNYVKDSTDFEKKYLEKKNILDEKIEKMSSNEKELIEFKEKIDLNIDDIYQLQNEILVAETNEEYLKTEKNKKKNLEREYISGLDSKREEMQEFIRSNIEISRKRDEETKKLEILNSKVDSSKEKIEKIETEKKELITMNSALNGRLNVLQVMEDQNESYSFAIKKVLEETKKNSEFKNLVKGVIANLIKSDSKYSLALEIVLGYSLQNIVVETKEDANKIINFLKEKNYGRATFLPMDTIKTTSVNKDMKMPHGIIGFATDIIFFDRKYENIINYLLGRVVIANDLESAISFSNGAGKNFKIVTLNGDLINPSGSMTGGSVKKGKTGMLSRKDEIKDLKKKKEKQEQRILKLEEDAKKESENLNNLRKLRTNYYKTYNKSSVDYAIYEEKQSKLSDEIKRFENLLDTVRSELLKIEEDLKNIEQLKLKNNEMKLEKEKENSKLENLLKIRENTKEKEEINDLKDEVTDLKISFSSFKDSVDSSLELANLIKEQIEKDTDLKEEKINIINKKEQEIKKEEEIISEYETKVQNFSNISKENAEKINEIIEREKETEQRINENQSNIEYTVQNIFEMEKKQSQLEFDLSKIEFERERLIENMWENYEITPQSKIDIPEEEYNKINLKDANIRIKELKSEIKNIGPVDISSIDEFRETKERKEFIEAQEKDMDLSIKEIEKAIKELTLAMKEEFTKKFAEINKHFKEVFSEFFTGGKATLELENEDDPLNSDIEIKAQPPGKKLQSMLLLSGGERTLTAIALLFAILKTNPSPICVLDEIEAALDDINIGRFTDYLKSYINKNIQFIIITHRKGTMESAESVYGATMEEKGITKLVSLDLMK